MQEVDITGAVEINGSVIELTMPLHADYFVSSTSGDSRVVDQYEFRSGYYEVVFGGLQEDNEILTIFVDWGESKLTKANRNPELSRRTFDSMKLVANAQPVSQNIVWQNEVFINETLEIDDDLVIRSGTVVRLGPNANLILSGHFFVQGTANSPVQFIPVTESQEPWGAIVLKGKAANGSELDHAVFRGGERLQG